MKGIVNVNIAGIAFRLDEAAYDRLNDYLRQIGHRYGDSSEGREITGDLETRIAEIILTRQNASAVVPLALIDEALAQLGAPEEISEGTASFAANSPAASSAFAADKRIAHRLYRNPDGARLGGVCNGLASYFDVDPVLVRLIFAAPLVLMVFFFILDWDDAGRTMVGFMTTTFILYPLLWVVIPKACTPLQKLEMQGEKITREKLEQTYREEFDRPGNAPAHIVRRARNARDASVFSEIVSILGRIVLFFIKAVVAIVGFGFIVGVLGVLLALFTVLFIPGSIRFDGVDFFPEWRLLLAALVVLIPLLLAVYGILKFLFGFRHNRPLMTSLTVVWLLAFAFGTVIFVKDFDRIRTGEGGIRSEWFDGLGHRRSVTRSTRDGGGTWSGEAVYPLAVRADTLFVAPMDGAELPEGFVLKLRGSDARRYAGPSLVLRSREGEDPADAKIDYILRGDTLYLKATAGQIDRLEINLYLPEGQAVVTAPGIDTNEYYERKNEE
jgi:phage shock protein PspC (stress-responsive transcriptional regulator)